MICAAVLLYNLSKEPWNTFDKGQQKIATKRCGEIYKEAPCLSRFIKVEYHMYRAICGPEKEKHENRD